MQKSSSFPDDNTKVIPDHASFKKVENRFLSKAEYNAHVDKLKESISEITSMKKKGLSIEEAFYFYNNDISIILQFIIL